MTTLIVILLIVSGASLVILGGLLARYLIRRQEELNRPTCQFDCPECKRRRPARMVMPKGRCFIECAVCGARVLF